MKKPPNSSQTLCKNGDGNPALPDNTVCWDCREAQLALNGPSPASREASIRNANKQLARMRGQIGMDGYSNTPP